MKGAKKKVLFQPSTGRVTRATTRGENQQPRCASAPRLGKSPETEPWELAQNQPGQVDTLSEENNLDQYTEMEGAAGGKNLPLGPPKGRPSMLPQFQRHEKDNLKAAERREQRLMELLRQSNEMQRGMSAQIEALKAEITELQSLISRRPEQKGLPSPPRAVTNPTDSFLRYQETPPLEPVTQDMLNSQMHRLRTPRRIDTPSHRQSRTNERESSHHPEIDRNSSFQGPRHEYDVAYAGKWCLNIGRLSLGPSPCQDSDTNMPT